MRIEYRLLWVEDDTSWFETTKKLFSDTLEELGFKMTVKRCRNLDEVKMEVERNNLKEYDLLLIDFNLGNNYSGTGYDVISFIRGIAGQPILTDVIFYSSAIDNVRASLRANHLEGVYSADRRDIDYKFELVVKTTIKKLQEVNTMRGLIMAETSDLDDLMVEIIDKVLETDIAPQLENYIKKIMKDSLKTNIKLLQEDSFVVREKIKDSRVFTSFHKARTINRVEKITGLIGIHNFYENYRDEVMIPRNIFAHVKERFIDGEKVLVSTSTGQRESFNEERCIEIRKNLIKYREILEGIK